MAFVLLRINGGFDMIDTKEMTLKHLLYKAQEAAVSVQTAQLVSWTKKIPTTNLLEVFRAAKQLNKDRIFWTNSTNDFSLIGIGSVHKIVAFDDRFHQVEQDWNQLVEGAMIHNEYNVSGTGLVALGGMSFDPLRERSELWEKYPPSQLTIPEIVFAQHKEDYYMTWNRLVEQTDNVEEMVHEMDSIEDTLRQTVSTTTTSKQTIMHKHVVAPEHWKQTVQRAVNEIKANRAKKIVLARELRITLNQQANIPEMLRHLLRTQPNSYIFAFEHGDNCFIGATPERLVQVEGEQLLSTCLAGTAPRGKTEEADEQMAKELLEDPKNREEHEYVVQMIKRSIEPSCEDIEIPKEPVIYPLRNLQHLYTPVKATLKDGYSVFDLIEKLHPTPALGGVPRDTALAFMREHEWLDRGWYGAPIGWVDSNKHSEFAVALRSGLVQADEVSLFAGCGVMRDSDPDMEFEETKMKFLPMLQIMEASDESY